MTKRIRSLFWGLATLSAFGFGEGCSCDPSIEQFTCPEGETIWVDPATGENTCVAFDPSALCLYEDIGANGGFCPDGKERFDEASGTWDCGTNMSDCELYDLEPGYMAQYLDSVTIAKGADAEAVAISGYSPGWLDPNGGLIEYGDLVYGEYTPGGEEIVTFQIIDGKPADSEDNVFFDPESWRGGNYEAGDNVGKYSSITTGPNGDVYIAYSDFTTRGSYRLKLAHRAPSATSFVISVIDDADPIANGGAFFPSITVGSDGNPVVAYSVREAAAAAGEQPTGWLRVATASSDAPAAVTDWAFAELGETTANVGCVDGDGLCATGDRCIADGTSGRGICRTPDDDCRDPVSNNAITCSGQFGVVSICVADACANVKGSTDQLDLVGVSTNLFVTGAGNLGLVYHDRGAGRVVSPRVACETDAQCTGATFCSGVVTPAADNDGSCMIPNGNLWGMRSTAGTWGSRFLIDGFSRKQATVGDCGNKVSLALAADGTWHLAYLDGTFDRIRYSRVASGATTATAFAFVDDGNVGINRPEDRTLGRRRLVGGELSLTIVGADDLRLLYQDITGMTNDNPAVEPPGSQPLFAKSTGGANWTVTYPTTEPVTNAGMWTTQSLGILPTTNSTSYCAWVDRSSTPASARDIVPDTAETHVLPCYAP